MSGNVQADSFLGSGDLYIDRLNEDGSSTGLMAAGNAVRFAIQSQSEVKEQTSRGRSTYGQVIASANLPKPSTLAITLDQLSPEVMAMAFLGEVKTINQGGGTVTDQAVTLLAGGRFVDLGKGNITAESVVLTNTAGDVAYAEGTDYEVHYRMGWVRALPEGLLASGGAAKIGFAHGAVSGKEISGATQPSIRARFVLDGKNETNGKPCRVEVFMAQIKPDSPVDFLSQDFSAMEMSGTMLTPSGKSTPYVVQMLD